MNEETKTVIFELAKIIGNKDFKTSADVLIKLMNYVKEKLKVIIKDDKK